MIDNFNDVVQLFEDKPLTDDDFFLLIIVKRRKDNPDMITGEEKIDNILIKNEKHLYDLKDNIIKKCIDNNARAYFYINSRSYKKTALLTLKRITDSIVSENYKIQNAYFSSAGKFSSDQDKHWVVDVDIEDIEDFEINMLDGEIIPFIKSLQSYPYNIKPVHLLKTKNGFHIICKPFKLDSFKRKYSEITVHKEGATLLYIP